MTVPNYQSVMLPLQSMASPEGRRLFCNTMQYLKYKTT